MGKALASVNGLPKRYNAASIERSFSDPRSAKSAKSLGLLERSGGYGARIRKVTCCLAWLLGIRISAQGLVQREVHRRPLA